MTSEQAIFDDLVPIVKERDGWRCVNQCHPRGPKDNEGHPKLLKVVRRDQWEPDTVDNLMTVCGTKGSKCVPEYER